LEVAVKAGKVGCSFDGETDSTKLLMLVNLGFAPMCWWNWSLANISMRKHYFFRKIAERYGTGKIPNTEYGLPVPGPELLEMNTISLNIIKKVYIYYFGISGHLILLSFKDAISYSTVYFWGICVGSRN